MPIQPIKLGTAALLATALIAGQALAQPVEQQRAVGQLGQGVVQRPVAQAKSKNNPCFAAMPLPAHPE